MLCICHYSIKLNSFIALKIPTVLLLNISTHPQVSTPHSWVPLIFLMLNVTYLPEMNSPWSWCILFFKLLVALVSWYLIRIFYICIHWWDWPAILIFPFHSFHLRFYYQGSANLIKWMVENILFFGGGVPGRVYEIGIVSRTFGRICYWNHMGLNFLLLFLLENFKLLIQSL